MVAPLRLLFAAALLVLPVWLALSTPVHACSCAGSLENVVSASDLIVVGTPADVELADPLPSATEARTPAAEPTQVAFTDIRWSVAVSEYVKGSGPDRLDVRSKTYVLITPGQGIQVQPGTDPTCGYAPQAGLAHLLFLTRRDDGLYTTGGCAGNQPITAETQASVATYLDRIREFLRGPTGLPNNGSGPPQEGGVNWLVPLIGSLFGIIASASFLALSRRRS